MGKASKDNYKSVIKTVRTVSGLSKSLADASGNGHDKFGRSGWFTSACGLGWHGKREDGKRGQPKPTVCRDAAEEAWTKNKNEKGMWANVARVRALQNTSQLIGQLS